MTQISHWEQCQQQNNKNCQLRILYTAKISFKSEGEIKTFSDIQVLKEFINRPGLQEC